MNNKILLIIKSVLGSVWALVFSVLGIMMFMDIDTAAQKIVVSQNIKIIPKYTGGEVVNTRSSDDYTMMVHEPIDDFVQIDWLAEEALPKQINEAIDVDLDGRIDLKVIIDTQNKTITYEKLSNEVRGLMQKTSLVDFENKVSTNNKDSLFFYHNRKYKQIQYGEGVSIRILKKLPK